MAIDISYNAHDDHLNLHAIILDKSNNIYSPEQNLFIESITPAAGTIYLTPNRFSSYGASVDSSSFATGPYIIKVYQRELIVTSGGEAGQAMRAILDQSSYPTWSPNLPGHTVCHCYVDGVETDPPGDGGFDDCMSIGGDWRCGEDDVQWSYNECMSKASDDYTQCEKDHRNFMDWLLNIHHRPNAECVCRRAVDQLICNFHFIFATADADELCKIWRQMHDSSTSPSCDYYRTTEIWDMRPEGCSVTGVGYNFEDIDVKDTLLHVSQFNWDAQLQREVDSLDSTYYLPEFLSYDVDQVYIVKTVPVESSTLLNVFQINDKPQPKIKLKRGNIYRFDQSNVSNGDRGHSGQHHPLRFSTSPDGTHNGGIEYGDGIEYATSPGNVRSYTTFEVTANAPPKLYYYCAHHPNMGGEINIVGGNINDFGNNTIGVATTRGSSTSNEVKIITR
jgi:hypothetical protein